MGYVGDAPLVFKGYVKNVDRESNTKYYTITAQDELVRAVDYFIVSSTPDNSFKRHNISAEILIKDILALAGITNYGYEATSFTFATQAPLEVNLIGAYDFCKQIADILAWHIYADTTGKVWFVDRKPHLDAGDTPSIYVTDVDILSANESKSDDDLRNRVVVYGKGDISATAQASSPYLPAGFYKASVLATDIIDKTSIAQQAADYNLTLLNRLKETVNLEIEGNPNLFARDIINVQESILGINGNYYAYAVEHNFGADGYKTTVVARK